MFTIRSLKEISYNRELRNVQAPDSLIIEKAKWKNFCDSPVNLMIDDLTNAWFDFNDNGKLDLGEDWGGKCGEQNSAISFLKKNLFYQFPHAAITFFAVIGTMNSFSSEYSFTSADTFNSDETIKRYYRDLIKRYNIEIAYHGLNHGVVDCTGSFVQEWQGFKDIDSACRQIRQGLEIYKDVFGCFPNGGKYGGYDYNDFADQSINECNFMWWCRNWTPRSILEKKVLSSSYELQYFGKNMVIDIPSTVHGRKWTKSQIDTLIKNQQVITIQEHIAKYRPHPNGIQQPNIIDDIDDLTKLYRFLQNKNVWHAKLSDIASYYDAYTMTIFSYISKNKFHINYRGKFVAPLLTVKIDCGEICLSQKPFVKIISEKGDSLDIEESYFDTTNYQHIINIPINTSSYEIIASNVK